MLSDLAKSKDLKITLRDNAARRLLQEEYKNGLSSANGWRFGVQGHDDGEIDETVVRYRKKTPQHQSSNPVSS
jgi:hypothetical protein